MSNVHFFSARRLNPFQGLTQIIDIGEGRAVSCDGVRWRIQIKSDFYKSPWSNFGMPRSEEQFFTYGVWSRTDELARVPIHPSLYCEDVEDIATELLQLLAAHGDRVPFAPEDNIELWLMDSKRSEPVALIASSCNEDQLPVVERLHWTPFPANTESFDSPIFREQQRHTTTRLHIRDMLNQALHRRTGSPVFGQWFRRHPQGSATGLEAFRGQSKLTGAHIKAERFPPLLITRQWPDPQDRQLIEDYLAWQAPYLLTLPELSDETRAELEHMAVLRASELETYHRLYPKMINESLIKSALVEAVMRRSV